MEARITLVGNLTADAEKKQKDNETYYHIFRVACNKNKDEAKFYTCFFYGMSEARAKLLKTGTQVYVYGIPDETINVNPSTGKSEINRIVNVKDLEITITKKNE